MTSRRRLLALSAVLALVALAGCLSVFGGISDEDLDREAEYDDLKAANATGAIDVDGGEYRVVYDLNGTAEMSVSRSAYHRDRPLDIEAVRYWYPNGTAVNGSALSIDQGRTSTSIAVPDGNGTLAFTADAGSRTLQVPAVEEGAYVLALPEGQRTSHLLFGSVSPSGYDRTIEDDRERLHWEDLDSTIHIRHYVSWHVPVFYVLVAVVGGLGGLALLRTKRQIERLREQRRELGLDVDLEDDDEDRPPPGFG